MKKTEFDEVLRVWEKFGKTWRNAKTKFGIGLGRDEERKMEIYATSYSPSSSSFDKFFIKLGNSIFSATSSSLDSARNYFIRDHDSKSMCDSREWYNSSIKTKRLVINIVFEKFVNKGELVSLFKNENWNTFFKQSYL